MSLPLRMGLSRELFIYWRVAPLDLDAAARAMASFQAALRLRHDGLQARLYLRSDDLGQVGEKATLMETYKVAGGVDEQLQTAIVLGGAQASAAWCQGPRHVEVFQPLPP